MTPTHGVSPGILKLGWRASGRSVALMGCSCCPGAWQGTLNGAAPDIPGVYSTRPEALPMEPEAAPPKGSRANPLHLQKCYTDRRRGVARLTRFRITRLVTILRSSV